MKNLYRKDNRYSQEAQVLDAEACKIIAPLFKKYLDEGFSPREISHIINAMVDVLELEAVLGRNDVAD